MIKFCFRSLDMDAQDPSKPAEEEKAHSRTLPCHVCTCPDWDDIDGDGACDNRNTFAVLCGHPIVSHY